jgi:deoxyribonuclease-4
MMRIGAHLSATGGYINALIRAHDIGANCLQLFSSSPRIWTIPDLSESTAEHFIREKEKFDINPIYFHATYLINLAGTAQLLERSVQSLIQELTMASKLHIKGSIVHLGSYKEKGLDVSKELRDKKYTTMIESIQNILRSTPQDTLFIIENAGSRKIGVTLEEIGQIILDINSPRIKVCIDTAHGHAAGYDISTQDKLNSFLDIFDEKIGINRLEVFQINDSKDVLGSFRDRHENIGEGTIGLDTFRLLLSDKRTADKPFILEVPGFEKKGPDAKNIEILNNLCKSADIT